MAPFCCSTSCYCRSCHPLSPLSTPSHIVLTLAITQVFPVSQRICCERIQVFVSLSILRPFVVLPQVFLSLHRFPEKLSAFVVPTSLFSRHSLSHCYSFPCLKVLWLNRADTRNIFLSCFQHTSLSWSFCSLVKCSVLSLNAFVPLQLFSFHSGHSPWAT